MFQSHIHSHSQHSYKYRERACVLNLQKDTGLRNVEFRLVQKAKITSMKKNREDGVGGLGLGLKPCPFPTAHAI